MMEKYTKLNLCNMQIVSMILYLIIMKKKYLNVGTDLIFESNLVKYMKYGNGFKSIKFVGNILK